MKILSLEQKQASLDKQKAHSADLALGRMEKYLPGQLTHLYPCNQYLHWYTKGAGR